MPVIRNVPLSLDASLLTRAGVGNRFKRRPGAAVLLDELLATALRERLIEPTLVYEMCPIAEIGRHHLCLEGGIVLSGPLLASQLASARKLTAMICTIGPRLERRAAEYFAQGKPLRGLMLDEIGNAALRYLTREATRLVSREASARNWRTSRPFSPGMSGWPLSEQRHLFRLVPGQQIGVSLTSSSMMIPRKSVSMVVGIGPDVADSLNADDCSYCAREGDCAYRVTCAG